MKTIILFLSCITCFVALGKVSKHYTDTVVGKRNFDSIIKNHLDQLSRNPDNLYLLRDLAEVYLSEGKWNEALFYFHKAFLIHPQSTKNLDGLGYTYHQLKNHSKAERYYQQSLAIEKNNPPTHYNLGALFYLQKKIEKAETSFLQAIQFDPVHLSSHFALGELYFKEKKNYLKAVTQLQQVLKINPKILIAYFRLGQCYFELNKKELALENFTYFIKTAKRQNSMTWEKQIRLAKKFINEINEFKQE